MRPLFESILDIENTQERMTGDIRNIQKLIKIYDELPDVILKATDDMCKETEFRYKVYAHRRYEVALSLDSSPREMEATEYRIRGFHKDDALKIWDAMCDIFKNIVNEYSSKSNHQISISRHLKDWSLVITPKGGTPFDVANIILENVNQPVVKLTIIHKPK